MFGVCWCAVAFLGEGFVCRVMYNVHTFFYFCLLFCLHEFLYCTHHFYFSLLPSLLFLFLSNMHILLIFDFYTCLSIRIRLFKTFGSAQLDWCMYIWKKRNPYDPYYSSFLSKNANFENFWRPLVSMHKNKKMKNLQQELTWQGIMKMWPLEMRSYYLNLN